MKLFKFTWYSELVESTMVGEVYHETATEALAALGLSDKEKRTAKLIQAAHFTPPNPGDVKFVGSRDEYLEDFGAEFD